MGNEQIADELPVMMMSAATRMNVAPQVTTDQGEIANAVQQFVAGTLIGRVHPVVDRPVRPKHEQILRRHSQPETLCLQRRHFLLQHKRTGEGDRVEE